MKTKQITAWTTETGRELLRFDPGASSSSEQFYVTACLCNISELRELRTAIDAVIAQAEQEEKSEMSSWG